MLYCDYIDHFKNNINRYKSFFLIKVSCKFEWYNVITVYYANVS